MSIKRELTVSVKKIYTIFYEISCPDPRTPFSAEAAACVRWEEGAGFSGHRVLHWYSKNKIETEKIW